MKKTISALFVLLVGASFPVAGQEAEQPVAGQEDEQNVTGFEFEDELVRGDLFKPNGEVLQVRKKNRSESLVRAREHFVPEMLESVEDL